MNNNLYFRVAAAEYGHFTNSLHALQSFLDNFFNKSSIVVYWRIVPGFTDHIEPGDRAVFTSRGGQLR